MALTQEEFEKLGLFYLGKEVESEDPVLYDSRDLVTHAVCVGMTGSGKTGLCIGLLEEAILDGVPAIVIDPKGDIGNLLLTFPELQPDDFEPWIDADEARRKNISVPELAQNKATLWREGLAKWGQDGERIQRLKDHAEFSIYTPGSSAGLSVSMLSSLAAPPKELLEDLELMTDRVSGTVTSILGLLGIEGDPLQSPEHIFISNIVTYYWNLGQSLDLAGLIGAIQNPPFSTIGVMDLDTIYPEKKRTGLAMKINNLIAAPAFASWMNGDALDVQKFLWTDEGKPRVSIFSISHLGETERMFFVSLLLNQVLGWVRTQSGTTSLRALLYMDEIFGYLPPVAEPPSKKPLLTLLKQARAYGLGLVLATQNPADIDYKALSNTGTWFLGRLQTERDRDRVLDGLVSASGGIDKASISKLLTGLESRSFLLHNVHEPNPIIFKTRWVMSYLKGPLTRDDVRTLMHDRQPVVATKTTTLEMEPVAAPPVPIVRPKPPNGVEERFLAIDVTAPADATLLYRPMVYGWGSVSFTDGRRNIDKQIAYGLVTGVQSGLTGADWGKSFRVDLDPSDFDQEPKPGEFMAFCDNAKKKTSYTEWKRALVDHLYQNETLDAWHCPALRLKSEGDEDLSAFTARVRAVVHEKRDDAVDKIRDKYGRKIQTARDKLQRAEDALATQEDQARHAQLDTAVSVGSSVLSMMFGRKSLRSATTSARRVSKTAKERRDVERAEQKHLDAQAQYVALEHEMEAALTDTAHDYAIERFPIEEEPIKAKKKDISVELFTLLWVPYWLLPSGERLLAVDG